jgi:hypothetical protein
MRIPCLLAVLANLVAVVAAAAAESERVWEFTGADGDGWRSTQDVRPLEASAGALRVATTGADPGITVPVAGFVPSAAEWVELRLRASHTGNAQFFWFQEDGEGFGETTFHIPRAGEWVDLAVFPAWGRSGPMRALRLDLYHFDAGCSFEIERIAVCSWPAAGAGLEAGPWVFDGPGATARWADWRPTRHADVFMSPLLAAEGPPAGGWAVVRLRAAVTCVPAVLWFDAKTGQAGRLAFPVRGDGVSRTYNVQLGGDPAWSGRCARVGLEIPLSVQASIQVEALALTAAPGGAPELAGRYLGFEEAHNRAGRPRRLLAVVENSGGGTTAAATVALGVPGGVALVGGAGAEAGVPALAPGERFRLSWEVQAALAGTYDVTLSGPAAGSPLATASLTFLPERPVVTAAYVPEPQPVATAVDVFMFYFPGWDSPAKWAPIRSETPERRPLLGWYDEANPECVDWQIKWAVENGISGFILDWYWNRGEQQLDHWLRAYRQARYRDQLKLFLLWCDHSGTDIRTPEDMRVLARHWIEQVFSLPGYYRLNGQPVVALFEPDRLRAALGGSAAVRQAFEICQTLAREAGYAGIAFLSANNNYPSAEAATLAAEGYYGATTYHEPGYDYHDCPSQQMRSYAKQVQTAPFKWQASLQANPAMAYFPVVDSGWDSRPWHAYRGAIVGGRSVARFEEWLRQGSDLCAARGIPLLVLGPANEWGEGSYLEPCTEFGFGMYEAVRRVLGKGDPAAWPENLSPADVGRGPYSFDMSAGRQRWTFDDGLQGWSAGSGCVVEARAGELQVRSVNEDPTLTCAVDFHAETVTQFVVRLRCRGGTEKANYGQLFWATEGDSLSGAAVVGFVFADSEEPREYRIALASAPRWRGRIVQLRFDPCCEAGLTVMVDEMRFE